MKYTEELTWILDKIDAKSGDESTYRENIAFVHSLGLKCDSVGWCDLDLSHPRTAEILEKIETFCKANGWQARGYYTRNYIDVVSDWYELVPTQFKDGTLSDGIDTVTKTGEEISTYILRAFHELTASPKSWGNERLVPERFRNFCLQNHFDFFDFCWAKDKGKYDAEQYFHVYGKQLIPEIAVDFHFKKSDTQRVQATGGWLPKIADMFYNLRIELSDCYLKKHMPETGIAYAYIPVNFSPHIGTNTILIHKDITKILLKEKVLPSTALRPAPVVESLPGGYILQKTYPIARPTQEFMDKMLSEYEKLKATSRPIRMVSEKEALKLLRNAKRVRKEDFQKGMTKTKGQDLSETDFSPLVPYYTIANGGYLSDEYELLSYSQALAEHEEFYQNLESEELFTEKPEGIVIAKCPDGDVILLCNNGAVCRFSHEVPELINQWTSLPQFIVDSINDD